MVRTRFAPSPTGYLHIGGARTALFSWLYARHFQGEFILRIEDTDVERSTKESIQAILDGMAWLGIDFDEGPFHQMHRLERYREVAEQLIKEGKAYRCNCTKERLEQMRAQQTANKEKPRYDGHCRDLELKPSSERYVVRFKNPHNGVVEFHDLIRGHISFQNSELDDLVLLRSDGIPTYNFAVVIDDLDMKITQVIRGDDHINNTPRQINIFHALNAKLPEFAHVPMILGSDGKRLSKRHGAVSVLQYRDDGYLPEALMNYLVRLGWSHGDQEIFNREELFNDFNLDSISRSAATFNPEKLMWLNQHYLKTLDPSVIAHPFSQQLKKLEIDFSEGPTLDSVIAVQAERSKTLVEMAERSRYFFAAFEHYDEKAAQKNLTPEILPALREMHQRIHDLNHWDKEALHQIVQQVADSLSLKLGQIAQPLRVALTGNTVSPPIDATLYLIGKECGLMRLKQAIKFIESKSF